MSEAVGLRRFRLDGDECDHCDDQDNDIPCAAEMTEDADGSWVRFDDAEPFVELLAACRAQHKAIDLLLAELVLRVPSFMPTQSPAWAACVQGNAAIKKAEGKL